MTTEQLLQDIERAVETALNAGVDAGWILDAVEGLVYKDDPMDDPAASDTTLYGVTVVDPSAVTKEDK